MRVSLMIWLRARAAAAIGLALVLLVLHAWVPHVHRMFDSVELNKADHAHTTTLGLLARLFSVELGPGHLEHGQINRSRNGADWVCFAFLTDETPSLVVLTAIFEGQYSLENHLPTWQLHRQKTSRGPPVV